MSSFHSLHSPFQSPSGMNSSLADAVPNARFVQYAILAALSLQVYDYIINFDEEVRLIWGRRNPSYQMVFYLNRYTPFLTVFSATYFSLISSDQSICHPAHFAVALVALTGAVFAEWTVFLRTCAICSSKSISLLLMILAVITPVGAGINTVLYVSHSKVLFGDVPHSGCLYWYRLKIEWISLVALIFCESVAFFLLIVKTIRLKRQSSSTIMQEICRDSIFYFVCIIGVSIANLLIQLFASNLLLCDILLIPQSILHQIFCTHFILRLRRLSEQSSVTISHGLHLSSPYRGPWCESDITV